MHGVYAATEDGPQADMSCSNTVVTALLLSSVPWLQTPTTSSLLFNMDVATSLFHACCDSLHMYSHVKGPAWLFWIEFQTPYLQVTHLHNCDQSPHPISQNFCCGFTLAVW